MLFDRVLGFFNRRPVAPEPLLALPAPTEAAIYRAEIVELKATLKALQEDGASSEEIDSTRFALGLARENLTATYWEQARDAREGCDVH